MPSTMSMSAADWTRIQRRRAGLRYASEAAKEVAPTAPGRIPAGTALLIPRDVGGSKFRRTASDYTNSVDARVADFFLKSQRENGSTKFMLTRLCSCVTAEMEPKTGLCVACLK
jgi:hypothetical protein